MSASRPHSTQELTQAVRDAVKMQHYTPLNDALARIEEQLEALREALDSISRLDTRWAHMDSESQKIARGALAASSPARESS